MSLLLQEQKDKRASLIQEYYFQVRQMEKFYDRDYAAARRIQSWFKSLKLRQKFLKMKKMTIFVQRRLRGLFARLKYRQLVEKEVNRRNIAYFSAQATIIQKYFRGYYKRKYFHDFYARKNYLKLMKIKNESFLKELNEKAEEEKFNEEKLRDQIAREEFNELAKNLHHLSSTSAIPGVYNSPFVNELPKAFDVPIENHLKSTFKANYQWKAPNRTIIESFKIKPVRTQVTARAK